ncbi:pteridine reductase [Sinimarinibacterium sp. NLF-5-8]|uniref:pteridine reductase n=1 Tax=Sinimarinibacterium sp. NLF-5-8 TaxID=2698684 RepID=UPI00137C2FC8|nr:pteridine reductase [Sinimarinibacterium sp. NLF-5-8]QHS10655.1 pteridine reductase [Sinimarinibacterium sp. NLF-5-8]
MLPVTPSATVLMTGAAHRVGAQTARTLHAQGWNVLIHAHRSIDQARALAAELCRARADSAAAVHADLNDPAALEPLAEQARARWGRLDALVNNASGYARTPLGTLTSEQFDALISSNLRAPLLLSQACAARMDGGAIVNIVDALLDRPMAGYSAYYAAKAGLKMVTQVLALELAPKIRVNAVAPGHMIWASSGGISNAEQQAELARIPLQRLGGAQAIADAVAYLLSEQASYVTGTVLPVDGGLRLG